MASLRLGLCAPRAALRGAACRSRCRPPLVVARPRAAARQMATTTVRLDDGWEPGTKSAAAADPAAPKAGSVAAAAPVAAPKAEDEAKKDSAVLRAGELLPGIAVAGIVMQTGFWGADVLGHQLFMLPASQPSPISGIPVSIVLGMVANNTLLNGSVPGHLKKGLDFAKDPMLKFGIICVGIKLSLVDVVSSGVMTVPAVCASIGMGMVVIPRLGAYMGLEPRMSSLIAAGTSICGVTAINALAPAINANKKEVTFAVANVVAFGLFGMLTYPYVAHYLFEHSEQVGMFLGLGVHDTSQVLGASLTYKEVYNDEVALQTATVTKLTRNMFLAAAIPYLTLQHAKDMATAEADGKAPSKLSLLKKSSFVVGFLAMAGVRSAGDFTSDGATVFGLIDAASWKHGCSYLGNDVASHYLLGTAMAAVGLNTSAKDVQGVGWEPFAVGAAGAAVVAGTGLGMAMLLPYCVPLGDNLIHAANNLPAVAAAGQNVLAAAAAAPPPVVAPAADPAGGVVGALSALIPGSANGGSTDGAVTGAVLGSLGATVIWGLEHFCLPK